MPRKPRLNMAGFHHIVNRGIERSNVYRSDEDKNKFLCSFPSVLGGNVYESYN